MCFAASAIYLEGTFARFGDKCKFMSLYFAVSVSWCHIDTCCVGFSKEHRFISVFFAVSSAYILKDKLARVRQFISVHYADFTWILSI
jgi:hypothetical protein